MYAVFLTNDADVVTLLVYGLHLGVAELRQCDRPP